MTSALGFKMTRYDVVRIENEQDVVLLAGHIFWHLSALHHPLRYKAVKHTILARWDFLVIWLWRCSSVEGWWRRVFLPGEFGGTQHCLFLQDLESLDCFPAVRGCKWSRSEKVLVDLALQRERWSVFWLSEEEGLLGKVNTGTRQQLQFYRSTWSIKQNTRLSKRH